ncbi:hypothetical protein ASPCADRAFT_206797 [Aspergillus carbonarius ITEM 5010]|uniref:Uncharacterized protein n=1 Tax=Aspergillus carbonarius (strain ITEM 5010) TaxID=602072 RepID=A0A1R3RQ56_ASPC5|nr:hypothetical protein ASPCADRAFT_206797 [Aspergillus carbonarius ITEM 5010]
MEEQFHDRVSKGAEEAVAIKMSRMCEFLAGQSDPVAGTSLVILFLPGRADN